MNRMYRTLWSVATQSWQAVPETAKTGGKKSSSSAAGVVASVALGFTLSGAAHAQSPPAINQLPTGGTVARGTATINQTATAQAAAMTVNQSSQRAVINWDTFNLGSKASINFVQPNAQAVTLNRVNDSNPSQIFGRMTANGQVFLSNANGVYFSPTSSVDVGALAATTHSISDDNFMSGKYVFERSGATGKVVNEGNINAALGGYVALLAPEVQNAGVVVAQAGTVALASGEMITLTIDGAGSLAGITTTPSTIATLVENKHAVLAPDGQIILSAVALDKLQAGVIKNSGSLEANSISNKGGKIYLEGDDITLTSTSKLEAKGATGGGTVLVGGDWQGSGTLRQATKVTMEAGATIDASATNNGDGGKVVLWSDVHNADSVTQVNGRIDAKAAGTGQGGQVETSGHSLSVGDAFQVDTGGGQWLLDPYNITISSAANANTANSSNTFTASASGGVINVSTLNSALSTNDVTVSTTSGGGDTGDITLSSTLTGANALAWSTNKTLTLSAAGGVTGSGNISITGSGTVVFNQAGNSTYSGAISGTGNFVKDGAGALQIGADQTYTGTTQVKTGTLEIVSGRTLSWDTAMTVDSGATFKYNSAMSVGAPTHVGSLAGSGTVEATGTTYTNVTLGVGQNNNSTTFDGVFKGTAPSLGPYIAKYGTGTFIYDGTVSGNFGGFSFVTNGGTVQVGTGGTGGSLGNVANANWYVPANSTLIINRNDALTLLNSFTGSGLIKLAGSVTVTSGGAATNFPNLEIGTSTTLALSGTDNIRTASWNGGAITNNGAISLSYAVLGSNVSGLGTLTANSGNNSLQGTNSYAGTTTINLGATLKIGESNAQTTGSLGTGAVVNNGGLTFYRSGTLTVANDISGSGSLNNSGTGTITLSGNNSYTDGTRLNAGTLVLGSSTALSTSGTIGLYGGGLKYSASNSADYSARFNVANNTTVTVDTAGQDVTWASAINTATGSSLVKNGTGTLLLSGNNTWDGSSGSSRAAVTVNGGTLELSGSSIHLGDTLSSMTGITNNGTLTFSNNNSANNININTRISGTGVLIKSGASDLTLSVGNEYTGGTRILGGNLIANGNGSTLKPSLGSIGTISFEGGTLKYSSATRDTNDYSPRFSTAANQAYKFNISGTRTWASALTSSGGTLTLDGGTLILSDNNSYSGATTVNSGTLIFSGNNTYSGAITVNGGTLQLGNGGTTGSVAGDIALSGLTKLKINRSGNFTLSNAISGTGDLDVNLVNPTDVVTLTGSNSFNAINLYKGALGLGSANAIGSPADAIYFFGGRLQYSAANHTTDYSGLFDTSSAGAAIDTNGQTVTIALSSFSSVGPFTSFAASSYPLSKYGTGTLILGANATYTGATYVYGGTLQVGTGSAGGAWTTSGAYVASGASLVFKPSSSATISTSVSQDPTSLTSGSVNFVQAASGDTTTYSGNLSNAVSLVEAGPGKLVLTGSASSTGTTTINAGGTLQVGNASTTGVLNTGDITNNGTLIYNRTDAKTIAAKISGTGDLVKQGALALTLTGANDYTGATTVSAGTLAITNATGLGTTAAGTTVANGATLDLQGVSVGNEAITLNGGTLATTTGTSSLSGTVALGAASTVSVGGTSLTLSGAVSGANALTKSGSGTLTLAAANSYSGATTVSAGTLVVTDAAGLGTTAAGTTVANGATLDLQGVAVGGEAITLSGGTLATSTGTSSLSGTVAMSAASTVNVGGTKLTLGGAVSGAYALTKSGTGTLVLANANTYSSTTLSAGTLRLANDTALGGSGITVPAGATLELGAIDGVTNLNVTGKTITLASSGTYEGGGYLHNVAGANTWSGAITLQNNSKIAVDTGTSLNLSSASSTVASAATVFLKPSDGNLTFGTLTGSGGAGYISSGAGQLQGSLVGLTAKSLVYARPIDANNLNSSYYGSAPSLTLGFFSASTGGTQYNLVSGTDYSGPIAYSGAPTATSVPGSYTISYTSGATISNAAYYLAGAGTSLTWTVARKPLTITAATVNKTYDGQAYSGGSVSYSAFANGQSASDLTGTLSYGGTAQGAINASSTPYTLTASGLSSSNYDISYVAGSLTIGKANLSKVTATKTYDGLSTVTAAQMTAIEGVNGETFTASGGTANISDKNVATLNKTLTDLSSLNLVGSSNSVLASNYNLGTGLPAAGSNNQVTISQRALTLAAANDSKTYDGLTSSSGTVTVTNKASADTVTATQSFASKDVLGSGQSTLQVNTGYTIVDGANADMSGNYAVTTQTATGTIVKANLSKVTTAKVYDGLSTVAFGQMTAIEGVNGETFTASAGTANISDKNVAGTKTLTDLSSLTLSSTNGGLVNNYNLGTGLPAAGSNNQVTISQRALTLAAVNDSKTYDGLTSSSGTVTVTNKVSTDTVTATQSFASKDVLGTGQSTLQVNNGYTIVDGANADMSGNYAVTTQTATGTITAKALTVTADDAVKNFGSANPALGVSISGYVPGENAANSGVTGAGLATTTATATTVAGTAVISASVGTLAASNYVFTNFVDGTLTIRPISVMNNAEVSTLIGAQLANLTGAQVGSFSATQLQVFSPQQLSSLSPSQLAGMTTSQLLALSPVQIAAINPAKIALMSATELSAFSNEQLQALSVSQIAAIDPAHFAELSPAQIMALSISQVINLTPDQLKGFSPAQVASLSAAELAYFDARQLAAIGIFPKAEPLVTATPPVITVTTTEASRTSTPASAQNTSLTQVQVVLVKPASAQTEGVVNVRVSAEVVSTSSSLVIPLAEHLDWRQLQSSEVVSVRLINGMNLPDWLDYQAPQRALVVKSIPPNALPLQVMVQIGERRYMVDIREADLNKVGIR